MRNVGTEVWRCADEDKHRGKNSVSSRKEWLMTENNGRLKAIALTIIKLAGVKKKKFAEKVSPHISRFFKVGW